MKRTLYTLAVTALMVSLFACNEQYITYEDRNYVMFTEAEQEKLVLQDQDYFTIQVGATNASTKDRTFGVEIVDKGSNAIEGVHYRLLSNSITIPAGERTTEVKIKGYYDNIQPTDSLGFILKLVMPEELQWDLYEENNTSKVTIYKSCPFVREDFTGWCLVSSLLIYSYPGENLSYERLVRAVAHPTRPNSVILEDFLYDGYDVAIDFSTEKPEQPLITLQPQVVSDEKSIFGYAYGDNKVLVEHSRNAESYFNSCQKFAVVWLHAYVENIGTPIGTIGHFYNVIEWVSDAEAEELRNEGL